MTEVSWTIRELQGMEVFLNQEEFDQNLPLQRDPKPGEELIVYNPMSGWVKAEVVSSDMARSESHIYPLDYCPERKCWVCTGAVNEKAVKKLMEAMDARAKPKSPEGA